MYVVWCVGFSFISCLRCDRWTMEESSDMSRRRALPSKRRAVTFSVGMIVLHTLMVILGKAHDGRSDKFHDHETTYGIVLLALRVALAFVFAIGIWSACVLGVQSVLRVVWCVMCHVWDVPCV
jgi:hypothetical protein